jgi:hypothetical protein
MAEASKAFLMVNPPSLARLSCAGRWGEFNQIDFGKSILKIEPTALLLFFGRFVARFTLSHTLTYVNETLM